MLRPALMLLLLASPLVAADPPKLDRHGMPLPPGAIARLGDARLRHASPVNHLAFSADGTRLLCLCEDQSVHVWDVKTGLPVAQFPVGSAQSASLPPDGKSLVVIDPKGHFKHFDLSDVRKPTRDDRIEGYTGGLAVLAPDGGSFAYLHGARDEEHFHIIRVADWKVTAEIASPRPGLTREAKFSGDGKRVGFLDVSYPEWAAVRIHASDGGRLLFTRMDEKSSFSGLALTTKGDRFSIQYNFLNSKRGCQIWDIPTVKKLVDRTVPFGSKLSATISPNGQLFVLMTPDLLQLGQVATGWVIRSHPKIESRGTMAFDSVGDTIAVDDADGIQRHDVRTLSPIEPIAERFPTWSWFVQISNERLYTSGRKHRLRGVWDLRTGQLIESIADVQDRADQHHGVSPSGRWLAYVMNSTDLKLRDRVANREFSLVKLSDPRSTILFPPGDTELVSVEAAPLTIRRYDLRSGELTVTKTRTELRECIERYSLSGNRLAVCEFNDGGDISRNIRLFDLRLGTEGVRVAWVLPEERHLSPIPTEFRDIALSADGRLLVVQLGEGLQESDTSDKHRHAVVRTFDTKTGRELSRYGRLHKFSPNISLSPDGRLLCIYDDGVGLHVVESISGDLRVSLNGHKGEVTRAVFTPDNRYLITASPDQSALVWDLWQAFSSSAPTNLGSAWEFLALREADKPHAAIAWLAARPAESVPFLAERVKAPEKPTAQQVAEWINQLNADAFRDREAAEAKLRGAVRDFAKTLEDAATTTTSPEVRTRLRKLLAAKDRWLPSPEERRMLRAIEVLERIGTPAARDVLKKLAVGPADACVTTDAAAALERLTK